MGDSVSEGTVLEWHKEEGDRSRRTRPSSRSRPTRSTPRSPPRRRHRREDPRRRGRHRHASAPCSRRSRRNGAAPATPDGAEAGRRGARRRTSRAGEAVDIVMPAMGESVTEGVMLEWAKSPATPSRPTRRSSRSRPTRSTPRSPPRVRHDHRDPRPGRRDGHRRPGHRPHDGRRRRDARRRGRPAARAGRRAGRGPAHGDECPTAPRPRPSRAASPPRTASTSRASHGTGPAGRISQGRRPRRREGGNGATAPRPPPPQARGRHADQGRVGDARPLHGRVALDPDRDVVPHDHRHDARRAAASSSRPPASKVSFTHLIAYAIARAATEQMPVMAHHFAEIDGKPHRIDDGAGQPRHRRRRREEGRRPHADGPGHPRRRAA